MWLHLLLVTSGAQLRLIKMLRTGKEDAGESIARRGVRASQGHGRSRLRLAAWEGSLVKRRSTTAACVFIQFILIEGGISIHVSYPCGDESYEASSSPHAT